MYIRYVCCAISHGLAPVIVFMKTIRFLHMFIFSAAIIHVRIYLELLIIVLVPLVIDT